jgi:hypothetical protein
MMLEILQWSLILWETTLVIVQDNAQIFLNQYLLKFSVQ